MVDQAHQADQLVTELTASLRRVGGITEINDITAQVREVTAEQRQVVERLGRRVQDSMAHIRTITHTV